ncbi:MAG: glycosyl hydrolase [Bacteroidota bacterium]
MKNIRHVQERRDETVSRLYITLSLFITLLFLIPFAVDAQKKKDDIEKEKETKSDIFKGLKFRSIGPALTSGRIADFAVNPKDHNEYYVAVACGHIWKTVNSGTTFNPVFDNYGSYSIGCLAMDPNNSNVVWAGTGENNHQRALGYGDGVYKTMDGGKSWKNMGLKESRQIGRILVDPGNSDVVYVAAEGSAWGPGGDRGVYKTTDGGKNWKKILEISEHTGVNDMAMDPRNPDIIYASSEQRRRHVHTKIGGGPETAIYKTTDGGENWKKLESGLPKEHMGGIGLDVSPVNPDIVYAIIEAANDEGGFFRSDDRGESWKKMSSHYSSGQYYSEIYCDPKDADKVYSVETISHFTEDGGKTFTPLGNNKRHVDDHALWIDPDDTKHFLIGGDGGVYESFDGGENYIFKTNLPVTQFYRVNADNSLPFYYVYGGTQDNFTLGGPSRNTCSEGVSSYEWFSALGGDGFWSAIDPENPDIVYCEYQYGNIARYDRKSGERVFIKPEPGKGEDTYKWNWNAPLILSPHSNTRLYSAANKVFRSDNRGNTWKVISGDLTAKIDRNKWPVMGKFWSIDAVVKDVSTSLYGTIISLEESPVKEDLLYAGTDDGLIHVTENAGVSWKKINKFPGVPEYTYVSDILASKFDENIVFASFDNRKRDDFKPYILKSTDKGSTWVSISGNLPENHTVHTIQQDHVKPGLLFAGTEFGFFFSIDGGKEWTRLKEGLPTISVKDIAIQRRENDIVLATFGRGFYILDDYTPLREFNPDIPEKNAYIFPIKDALMFIQTDGKYGQGSAYFTAKNPDFGATFTYFVKDTLLTLKQKRHNKEKELFKNGSPIPQPSDTELETEKNEDPPYMLFTIMDEQGDIVRKLTAKSKAGISRITWDLRYSNTSPVSIGEEKVPFKTNKGGMLALPGEYTVSLSKVENGKETELASPVGFKTVVLNNTTLPAENRKDLVDFMKRVSEVSGIVRGTVNFAGELAKRVDHIKKALLLTPDVSPELMAKAKEMELQIEDILYKFTGTRPKASSEEIRPGPVPINDRLDVLAWGHSQSTSAPTQTQKDALKIIEEEFPPLLDQLKQIYDVDLKEIEKSMDKAGAPWTPGRVPVWKSKK